MNYLVRVRQIDRNGNVGSNKLRFHVPVSLSDARNNTAIPAMNALNSISDAIVIGYECIWSERIEGVDNSTEAIDLADAVLFIIRTVDDEYVGITIPAPKSSIFVEAGIYAGIIVKSEVCEALQDFLASFPISDALQWGEAIQIADIVGVRVI